MDIDLLLNNSKSTAAGGTYLNSHHARNLLYGPCKIHPISPPLRSPFSPEDDALMAYMIDHIYSGRMAILGVCLKRGSQGLTARWNVLEDYEPRSRCFQCRQFRKKFEELRRSYRGSDWTIICHIVNLKVSVAIPPPRFIEHGTRPPLPIVVRARSLEPSNPLLSPYITLNDDDDARLPVQRFDEHAQKASFVFSFEQPVVESCRLRLFFQANSMSVQHYIEFYISCVKIS